MGGQNQYIETGGFSEYLYEQIGKTVHMNGLTGKMIKLKTDKDGTHTGLPSFSNTSEAESDMTIVILLNCLTATNA